MEQHSKRRRLSQKEEPPLRGYLEPEEGRRPHGRHKMVEEAPLAPQATLQKVYPPSIIPAPFRSQLNKTRHSGQTRRLSNSYLPKLFPRDPVDIESPDSPLTTAIASVIQVMVELPKSRLTQILIPPTSSLLSLEGYEVLTVVASPSPSLLSPTPANVALASSSADAVNAAQASASSQLAHDPKNSDSPADSKTVAGTFLPHPTSLNTHLPGHDSQEVLLSSSLTLLPPHRASSVLADAAGSIFQTLPGISSPSLGTPASPQSTSPPSHKTENVIGAATSDSGVPSESIDLESFADSDPVYQFIYPEPSQLWPAKAPCFPESLARPRKQPPYRHQNPPPPKIRRR